MKKILLQISFLLMILNVSAQENSDKIVARVNGSVITEFDVIKEANFQLVQIQKMFKADPEAMKKHMAEVKKETIQILINNKLILSNFKEKQYRVPSILIDRRLQDKIRQLTGGDRAKFIKKLDQINMSYDEFRKRIEESLAVEMMYNQFVKKASEVQPSSIRSHFMKNKEKFRTDARIKLQIIIIYRKNYDSDAEYLEKIKEVEEAMEDNSFGDVADAYTEQKNASEKGDLGWIDSKNLREDFKNHIKDVKDGKVAKKLMLKEKGKNTETNFIKVNSREKGKMRSYNQVRNFIKRKLESEKEKVVFTKYISKLRKEAVVEEFPIK